LAVLGPDADALATLEFLLDAGLLHDRVRRMPRLDHAIDGELAVCKRTVPDLMIADLGDEGSIRALSGLAYFTLV
jgi:hypothetical protein